MVTVHESGNMMSLHQGNAAHSDGKQSVFGSVHRVLWEQSLSLIPGQTNMQTGHKAKPYTQCPDPVANDTHAISYT